MDNSFDTANESDEDFDWEEVAVPTDGQAVPDGESTYTNVEEGPSTAVRPNIEITLHAKPKPDDASKKKAAAVQAERVARVACHKMHTILLLGNASVRNKWINDDILKARLMSLTPMSIQNAFAMIHRSRIPEAAKRGRMFESAMTRLVEWWYKTFRVLPTGHIRSRTYEDVQRELLSKAARAKDRKGKSRAKDLEDEDEDEGELIRDERSLMKHALMRRGSRDVSAQLFTSLCRALGIPARLVVSIQSVPWQANVGKPKTAAKKKPKKQDDKGKQPDDDEESGMEDIEIPSRGTSFPGNGLSLNGRSTPPSDTKGKGKQKAPPVINLRKGRGRKLGSATPPVKPTREQTPDPTTTPPVFWTEVFSRADARWLPVDPVRFIVNKRRVFDPSSSIGMQPGMRVENRMVYVVAFEEDGYARDVTPRYASEFGAKTSKMQQGGKGKQDWWERVMAIMRRPYRLNRDDLEDDELHVNQLTEQMPNSMAGFKNHPLYVLERHLKRDEVIHPLTELGKFRGEPVYPRSSVVTLKTAENWMRQGRKVREGCQPMKWVKQNAVTVNKKRAIEMAMADRSDGLAVAGGDQGAGFSSEPDVMQGMYSESQTELYRPDPVINGKVPKNNFGNIDLYVPTMLPAGGAYVPYKGVAKIAHQLGIDCAEAVTGFEFKKRRAFPVISGVVVAAENEEMLREAYWAAEQEAEEKRRTKRQEQVIKRWQRLIQGLRIRQRLQDQYAGKETQQAPESTEECEKVTGGFLSTADDVVQPYTLPRNFHPVLDSSDHQHLPLNTQDGNANAGSSHDNVGVDPISHGGAVVVREPLRMETFDIEDAHDIGPDTDTPVLGSLTRAGGAPKTMRELAEEAVAVGPLEQQHENGISSPTQTGVTVRSNSTASPVPATPSNGRRADGGRNASRRGARAGASNGTTKSATASSSKVKSTPPQARRGRKRVREEIVIDSDDEDEDDEDGGGDGTTKRSRHTSIQPPVVQVPRSDRVLRSRKSKTEAQLQEEKEQEAAYRRAIA
ncbi:hypothetical protein BDY19DRAFT_892387 [Irpex rosettiformis]|uniref:Uncharacterized protein n=1 Tax=Irpex rosettiformis TaxID=378272 RepID=A0ACB8U044_9APHY|nr:hypothetical protein BDY19DRAFT_892387 [Irpex rosettiformis]